jgi:hypothetical protein
MSSVIEKLLLMECDTIRALFRKSDVEERGKNETPGHQKNEEEDTHLRKTYQDFPTFNNRSFELPTWP